MALLSEVRSSGESSGGARRHADVRALGSLLAQFGDERYAEIHTALLVLAYSLLCWRRLKSLRKSFLGMSLGGDVCAHECAVGHLLDDLVLDRADALDLDAHTVARDEPRLSLPAGRDA
jgi:hypothetical protein